LLPVTPFVEKDPADPGPHTELTHPYVRAWAQLFNLRYTMLIVIVSGAMDASRADGGGDDRSALVGDEIFHKVMRHVRQLIEHMVSATLTSLGISGPTFELMLDEVPAEPARRWLLLADLLTKERAIIHELQDPNAHSESKGDTSGRQLLDDIFGHNAELGEFVTGHLT